MENQIIRIESAYWKSLMLTGDEMWLSQNKVSSVDKFSASVQKTGMMKSAYAYPLSAIYEIQINEESEAVKMRYKDEKGKDKKWNFGFHSNNNAQLFGNYLGQKLGLSKNTKHESKVQPLLLNLLYLVLTVAATWFLGTMDDTGDLTNSSSRRTRNRGAFLKVIVDTIGQTAIIIIGALVSLYIIYQLYKRFQNPASDIVYS